MTATLLRPSSSLACPPRWATPRTDRLTYGGKVAEIAESLGQPLMPWQRHVADVALEVDPETGRLAYREVVLTVPRQSGKTTLILAVAVHRALGFGSRQNIVYSAQTRIDARKKWEDEHLPTLKSSPVGPLFRARKTTGNEAFLWKNGSTHGLVSATRKSGHGPTLDLAFLDEAFAQVDDRLEQAFRPAMITRPQPQIWPVSTAGTAESVYLRGKVAAGRARLGVGSPSTTAYFEWSAAEDEDPQDPATWYGCMPALGDPELGFTVTEDAIRSELASMLEEHGPDGLRLFRRAYLNQWTDEMAEAWRVIPKASWASRLVSSVRPGAPAFAVAASWPDAEWASIGVAGMAEGRLVVQVVDHHLGTDWVPARLAELRDRHNPCALVVRDRGPTSALHAQLTTAGFDLVTPWVKEAAAAFGLFYRAAVTGDPPLGHFGQDDLDAAVAAAAREPVSDGWVWARKGETDISPVEAVTLASWGHLTRAHLFADYDVLRSVY